MKTLKNKCEDVWKQIIKERAGFKSELSGAKGKVIGGDAILHAHHIARKPNYRLRFELDNGICLTAWEHRYGIHGDHEEEYREKIKKVKGDDIYERMLMLKRINGKTDLHLVYLFLKQELLKIQAKK